jgi:hypothetical protein
MNSIFKKLFENKKDRFIREIDELLDAGECSIDTEMLLQIAKRKVLQEGVRYVEGQKFIRQGFARINLTSGKKLSSKERAYWHKLQGRAGGKAGGAW